MKKSKLPLQLANNASKLHKRIGELLTSEQSIFKNYLIRQEYNVKKVNPNFISAREKYDWVIIPFAVIEVMGRQHYEYIPHFHTSMKDFIKQQERDYKKKEAALEAGWAYITVSYLEDKFCYHELEERILDQVTHLPKITNKPKKTKTKIRSKGFAKPPKGFKYRWKKEDKLNGSK